MKVYYEAREEEAEDIVAHGFGETFDEEGILGVAVSAEPGALINPDHSVWLAIDIPDEEAQRPAPEAWHWLVHAHSLNSYGHRRYWTDPAITEDRVAAEMVRTRELFVQQMAADGVPEAQRQERLDREMRLAERRIRQGWVAP